MPVYVYGCDSAPEHPRQQVAHGMFEVLQLECETCHAMMHRIPQPFNHATPPMDRGLRQTYEIHSFNKGKYYANKARREANEAARRHALERNGRNPAPAGPGR